MSAERHEDAGDHQVHSSVPAEVLHGKPGEPGSAAQEPQPVPQPWGTVPLHLIPVMQLIIQFWNLVQKHTPVPPTGHSLDYTQATEQVFIFTQMLNPSGCSFEASDMTEVCPR